jgi:hypothetical protein
MLDKEKLNFWQESGLLDGMGEKEEYTAAVLLDSVSIFIDKNYDFLHDQIPYFAIPMTVRIFKKTKSFFNISEFVHNLSDLVIKLQEIDSDIFKEIFNSDDPDDEEVKNILMINDFDEENLPEKDENAIFMLRRFCESIESSLLN